jgi:hypothetical protein
VSRYLLTILAALIVLPVTILTRLWPAIVVTVQTVAVLCLFAFIGALIGKGF